MRASVSSLGRGSEGRDIVPVRRSLLVQFADLRGRPFLFHSEAEKHASGLRSCGRGFPELAGIEGGARECREGEVRVEGLQGALLQERTEGGTYVHRELDGLYYAV
ncbi:hypothetical protein HS1genome_1879 [Sulfodiicoccus acidiphilus]|uniref:Uncharacterized protein n=1 Tax=Sulfodiicoccus acidiphilus TaxID=1670455 RepID=A0A348B5N8_9CREN|nr:hypothetical protein HS1genome_1879 [Sulfodiicoccus acidiphilus]